jgi:hypothetical protein
MVSPGDLILVKSTGAVFAAGRRMTGNPYDHVAVVVSDGGTLNIDKPSSRLLPQERLLRPHLHPLVLRPAWPSPEDRDRFVGWIESLVGRQYDTGRTLRLVPRRLLRRFLGVAVPLERPPLDAPRWICTDAVLMGLERTLPLGDALEALALDWIVLRCGTTNDFLVLSERRPDLLAPVPTRPRPADR